MSLTRKCPSFHAWERLLSESLPVAEVSRLRDHLIGCERCRSLGRELGVDPFITGESDDDPSPTMVISSETAADVYANLTPNLSDGDELGGYRIVALLGEGGMGSVYLAEDVRLGRRVALKVLKPGPGICAGFARESFFEEARALASVSDDHVVRVHQVGEDRKTPFLAMEFLEGESLQDRMLRPGSLDLAAVLRVVREAAQGLAAIHARGLVHLDIKPSNMWLALERGTERVKILDFGLCRPWLSAGDSPFGGLLGTPQYMAPEQIRGEPLGPTCDLFALGCVAYEIFAGVPAFRGEGVMDTLLAVQLEEPVPLARFRPDLPPAVCELVAELLAKDSSQRPPSAGALIDRIDRIDPPRRRLPQLAMMGLAGAIAFAVSLAVSWFATD